jgi:hypothetical protein
MQEEIKSLVQSLDWRADPKPSTYQKKAWETLLTFPRAEVVAALKEFKEELVRNCPSFWPYDYERRLP